ncbi:MAG: hypothetical protein KBC20_04340 [Oscillospiraceae bacterium]|nr:hypothetical protein [Oscillospiraceae bacterium]
METAGEAAEMISGEKPDEAKKRFWLRHLLETWKAGRFLFSPLFPKIRPCAAKTRQRISAPAAQISSAPDDRRVIPKI